MAHFDKQMLVKFLRAVSYIATAVAGWLTSSAGVI